MDHRQRGLWNLQKILRREDGSPLDDVQGGMVYTHDDMASLLTKNIEKQFLIEVTPEDDQGIVRSRAVDIRRKVSRTR